MPSDVRSKEEPRALPHWVGVLDAIVVGLIAVAVLVELFGGLRIHIGWLRVSLRTPWKILIEALVLAAVRHALSPRPTLFHVVVSLARDPVRTAARMRSSLARMPAGFWPAVAIMLGTRLPVLLLGYVAVTSVGYPQDITPAWRASTDELWNLPARWDSGWYLDIVHAGYDQDPEGGQRNVAFFPAFPLLMRGMSFVLWGSGSDAARVLWAGVVVSLIAFFAALFYLFRLARAQLGEPAVFSLTLLAAYPFAVFFSAAYTESLFLLAAAATFWYFSRRRWLPAVFWGLAAGLTRPNGWTLSVPLAVLALADLLPATRRWLVPGHAKPPAEATGATWSLKSAAAVGAPFLGFLAHSAYLYVRTGDPVAWARVMKYWNRDYQGLQMIGHNLDDLMALGVIQYAGQHPVDLLNGLALLFALFSVVPVTRRLGAAYGLFILTNVALPVISGGLVSVGRYSSVLFPAFFWLGAATPAGARPALIALFALGQGLAAIFFFTWRPMY